MTHPLPPNKKEKITAAQNPSHDKSLPIEKRLADFLGKYHILLNGVNAHEPFYLKYEGKPNVRCDDDEKQRIIEFVNLLLSQAKQKEKEICILHFGSKGGRDMSTLFAWGENPGANCSCKNNWELFKGKTEKVMFIVTYDRVDRDPTETFSSKKELDEWLKQTKENKNIIYDSIKVYEVGKQYNVKVTYALREVK